MCWNFIHDDVIKWKHFPRYWRFVRRIHRSPGNFPHKGQWIGALMFSLICVWINNWSKQSRGWWFETLSRPLWRHCNGSTSFRGVRQVIWSTLERRNINQCTNTMYVGHIRNIALWFLLTYLTYISPFTKIVICIPIVFQSFQIYHQFVFSG